MFFSRFEAAACGSPAIEAEHLLMGLIRAAEQTRGRLFERLRLSLEDVRTAGRERAAGEPLGTLVHIPFSPIARRALRQAVVAADAHRHQDIRIAHLLLGILHEPDAAVADLFADRGADVDALRADLDGVLSEDPL